MIEQLENDSEEIRSLIISGNFSEEQIKVIEDNYDELCLLYNKKNLDVAIRSSAICEDLENASFAGQQDTYLNISGLDKIIISIKKCFASLYTSRSISYRKRYNIDHKDVKLCAVVQKMVRSDIGSAGVAFSIDTESGYDKSIIINSSFGLGESVVSGLIKPDEFILDKRVLKYIDGDSLIMKKLGTKDQKIIYSENGGTMEIETNLIEKLNFSLTNSQSITLARFVLLLEENYSKMLNKKVGVDCEFAIDGTDQKIYIIQTRPETIHSNNHNLNIKKYILEENGKILCKGIAVGEKISTGKVKILTSIKEHHLFNTGDILVTTYTTPDWEPLMKIASALITNKGGRTSHASIISREFGLNAIVGCGDATEVLKNIDEITVSCAQGEEGFIYNGILKYHIDEFEFNDNIKLPIKLKLNVGNPESSFGNSLIPNSGVGLGRMEFIINNYIGIHPKALINYPKIRNDIREKIYNIIGSHDNGKWYFIKRLARGIAKIAAPFYPNEVIIRLSDFKSNEYRNLLGGELYEPEENNSLLGWRGAVRYYSKEYEDAFKLECEALKYVRETMMMDNVVIMIPFCRTTKECQIVIDKMASYGLVRGENGLKIYLMCEIVSNVIEAEEFSPMIDGISIGGNDLLMSVTSTDRDNELLMEIADDKNLSYRRLIKMAIEIYKKNGKSTGFCGNQVSTSIEFCKFLIECGIDSISVTSDVALKTLLNLSNNK
jgi:pyruvate,water dikinase